MPELSVIVPVYDEEANVVPLVEELGRVLDGLGRTAEIVVVDDGSTDRSGALLTALAAEEPRLRVVRLARNYGQTAALAAEVGARIVEMPVHHRPRTAGRSKYGLSRTLRVMLDLLTVKFLSGYSTRPIHLFGLVGLLCSLAGLGLVGVLGFQRIVFGVPLANRPIVLLGILMVVVGVQFVSIGLLGEMLVRTYHESQTKPVYRVREIIEPAEAKRVRELGLLRGRTVPPPPV